ncbi:MAG: peroxiredoxin [bacterium]|nr:peroxiredoxin [bacterium]
MLKLGKPAPDFSLVNQDGQTVQLRSLHGKKVVLFAFPALDDPPSVAQATGFRDRLAEIETANTVIFGISADSPERLQAWKADHTLPFDLLCDSDHTMLEAWGAWGVLNVKNRSFAAPLRAYWVVDENGLLLDYRVRVTAADSIERALKAIYP